MGAGDPARLLAGLFRKYYRECEVYEPPRMERREFAFVYFREEGMRRHLSFASRRELKAHLASKAPMHVYYSSAYYESPSAPDMGSKVWLGADLVFDIDVDHIETPCKELHDRWRCLSCGAEGRGSTPKCPRCGSERLEKESWICDLCISVARDETLKLVDFLLEDFGFSKDELVIVFSGHRGFHVHVESEVVLQLGQDGRREIADYLRGFGLDHRLFFPSRKSKIAPTYNPKMGDPGWLGRVARSIYDLLASAEVEDLVGLGISKRKAAALLEIRDSLCPLLDGSSDRWSTASRVGGATWRRLVEYAAAREGVHIDERVTVDLKRLIRLPNSLHGKTGLRAALLDLASLEEFDVEKYAVALPRELVKIKVRDPPERILGFEIGAREGIVEVPLYLAAYLLANGRRFELLR